MCSLYSCIIMCSLQKPLFLSWATRSVQYWIEHIAVQSTYAMHDGNAHQATSIYVACEGLLGVHGGGRAGVDLIQALPAEV